MSSVIGRPPAKKPKKPYTKQNKLPRGKQNKQTNKKFLKKHRICVN